MFRPAYLLIALASCGGAGEEPAIDGPIGVDAPIVDGPPLIDAPPFSCSAATLDCPAGTVTVFDGAVCFNACSELVSQQTAEQRCVAWGGHLAALHSAADQTKVLGLVSAPLWIGHIQKLPGGVVLPSTGWRWLDGSTVDFEPWASGQPDDGNGSENDAEDCAAIVTTTWADEPCSNKHHFVCKH